ncbi:MAG: hypothetical protein RL684_282, partial [Pseudomonadota bacterium]
GQVLTPLLIFDQFEEIFTLAQGDDFGRTRAAHFIEELADLCENRPPRSLEARLEQDDGAAERFDFARGDYRVLISLREDYLAPLEGLKKAMPSISQNRLRLAPMTGEQALQAVLQPGKRLVNAEVAAAIVRFVAGGAELANAEVEPSLLSLICRELNDARISQGRPEISLDLLDGSHATILGNFYERALGDQLPAVRHVIEDDLLTGTGYRENVAEERLQQRLQAAGAPPGTLATLVNRRLLRIEERLDVRRVELTHDVLCGVVKASRDLRREREALEATERRLAEQAARERAAHDALVRARKIATVCVVLALCAVVGAGYAWFSSQRAKRAEQLAETARNNAEHLLGYLTDDFVRELESFGQLSVVAEFSHRQIDYFHDLPPALRGAETTRNGALAMIHYARAKRVLGDWQEAAKSCDEAIGLLDALTAKGDHSEATTIALAAANTTRAGVLDNRNDPDGPTAGKRGADLLRDLAHAPGASVAVRRAYVEALVRVSWEQLNGQKNDMARATGEDGMAIADALGAHDASRLDMGANFAELAAWRVGALVNLGRNDEARRVGEDAVAVADKVLQRRPGYRVALHGQQVIVSSLSNVAQNELNPREAIRFSLQGRDISHTMLQLDPDNVITLNNLGVADQVLGDSYWSMGGLKESIASYQESLRDYRQAAPGGASFVAVLGFDSASTSFRQAQMGDASGAKATLAAFNPYLEGLRKSEARSSTLLGVEESLVKIGAAALQWQAGDLPGAHRLAAEGNAILRALKPRGDLEVSQTANSLAFGLAMQGRVEYLQGQYAAAETDLKEAIVARKVWGTEAIPDKRDIGEFSTWLAMALVREGKRDEAAALIAPIAQFQRELAARNHGDQWLHVELAGALYAQALSQPAQAPGLLREAAASLDVAAPALRALNDVQRWHDWIAQASQEAHIG